MYPSPSNNSKDTQEGTRNEELAVIPITKFVIFKNLVVIGVGALTLLTTADVLELFQSTLNVQGGVGVASIAVQYATSVIGALFLPKYLIKRFGSKAVIVISMTSFVPFVVANYIPLYPLMILSSVSMGVGFTLFMGTIDAYLNDLATFYNQIIKTEHDKRDARETTKSHETYSENSITYSPYEAVDKASTSQNAKSDFWEYSIPYQADVGAIHSGELQTKTKFKKHNPESTTSRIFGLYSMIYQTSFIWGSLMSYYVLQTGYSENHHLQVYNDTCICGASYCLDETACLEQNLMQPSTETRDILISICLGLCVVAVVIIMMFFNDLKPKDKNVSLSLKMLLATFQQAQKRNHLLLIPLTLHNGMMKAFYVTDFTKSYVGCAWGIEHVGLVTAVGGGTVAFTSTVTGWMIRYTGRRPVFATAAALNMALNVMLILWSPDPHYPEMLFVTAVIWGVVFGIFYTQVKALYGVLFKEDEEAAFGVYQVWQCIGSCICLSYSNYICNDIKIYILGAFCTLGMVGYFLVENSHEREIKEQFSDSTPNKGVITNLEESK